MIEHNYNQNIIEQVSKLLKVSTFHNSCNSSLLIKVFIKFVTLELIFSNIPKNSQATERGATGCTVLVAAHIKYCDSLIIAISSTDILCLILSCC